MLALNLEVIHSIGEGFALNCPSDHYPFIIDKKSTDSVLSFNHSRATLT